MVKKNRQGVRLTATLYNSISNKKVKSSSSEVMISKIKSLNKHVSFMNKNDQNSVNLDADENTE